ncbi:MAG: NFACT family protein [Thermotogae bacterium]|jgi:predicted ribosome quality control (RQC) complex YloA/Tae2 family protein|nr:NFACT family protein [Thermotogota bacterium]MCL5031808.1 NFACT family protein [Thermotogota bacterium]
MPYDSFLVAKIVKEVETPVYLTGIYDATGHSIVLSLNKQDLMIDVGGWPNFRFTKIFVEKDVNPSNFVSLMRTKLKRSILLRVSQVDFDRIVKFEFEVKNLIGEKEIFELYHEVMGSFGNIILVKDGKVISTFKNVSSVKRTILPGVNYVLPDEDRIEPWKVDENLFLNATGRLDQFLVSKVRGFSKKTAIEVAKIANLSFDTEIASLKIDEIGRIVELIRKMVKDLDDRQVYLSFDGKMPKDIYAFEPYGEFKIFESASEAIEKLLSGTKEESPILKKERLSKSVKSLIDKNAEILRKIRQELKESDNAEEFRKYGELLMSHLHELPKKSQRVEVLDWETNKTVVVNLDPKIDVSKNAQHFFSIYTRLKNKHDGIVKRAETIQKRMSYLQEIAYEIENISETAELDEIEKELSIFKYISVRKKQKIQKESNPIEYDIKDFKIIIGKNNIQNDRITRSASPDDLWFHAREVPGSHVILVTGKREPSDDVIELAASFAAGHSKYRNDLWASVDYTYVKYVSKPKGAKPGFVTYKNFKTLRVKPRSV